MILRSLLLAAALVTAPALADPPLRTITMTGNGIVTAEPDQASFSTGVVAEGKTAAAALAANSLLMNQVMAALKRLGVSEKKIQTSNFSLSPKYVTVEIGKRSEQRLSGYQVYNTVTVAVDDVKRIGAIIDALVSAGANQAGSIRFSVRTPEPLLAKAREAAAKDAIAKAETYAKAAGTELGPVLSISESGTYAPQFDNDTVVVTAMRADKTSPIAAGEQNISATITIVWQIK